MKQHTIKREYTFCGKGLHTGGLVEMTLLPAPENHGIVFERADMGGAKIAADISNISTTDRSTCLRCSGVDVITTEHLLSAFSGLGVDNALVRLSNRELPIMDGSARLYAEAICADGLLEQKAERERMVIDEPFEFRSGDSFIRVEPSDRFEADVTVEFPSRVIGHQEAHFDETMDYASEIAPCRTFCFFHEIEFLLAHNMIKGGDMDNAIVIVENEVPAETIARMQTIFNFPGLKRIPSGYLNNLELRFANECARHKMLDLIGDLSLAGKPLNARITAFKPGHALNTAAVKALMSKR